METLQNDQIDVRGFARPRPLQAMGASIESGRGGVRAVRRGIEALPTLAAAITWLLARVAEEKRKAFECDLSDLRMDPETGAMVHKASKNGGTLLTPVAFSHLMQLTPAASRRRGAAGYLAALPPARRAAEVNANIEETVAAGEDRRIVMQLRHVVQADGDTQTLPTTYMIGSSRYAVVGPDAVGRDILAAAEMDPTIADSKAEVLYNGEVTSLKLFSATDRALVALGKDESFAAVLSLLLDDRKARSIPVMLSVLRSTCTNLDLVCRDGKVDLARWRHVGNARRIRSEIVDTMREGHQLLPSWVNTYKTAATAPLPAHHEGLDVLAMLCGALPGQKKTHAMLQAPSVRPETTARVVAEAWAQEGSQQTQGALCNAVTRAAHEQPWPTLDASRGLERQASLLRATPPEKFKAIIDAEFTKLSTTKTEALN